MKKNEKNFIQNENNLKDVSGGLGKGVNVNTDVKINARDIKGLDFTKNTDNSTNNTGNNVGYKDLSVSGNHSSYSVGGDITFN